jgi:hypothetical protein
MWACPLFLLSRVRFLSSTSFMLLCVMCGCMYCVRLFLPRVCFPVQHSDMGVVRSEVERRHRRWLSAVPFWRHIPSELSLILASPVGPTATLISFPAYAAVCFLRVRVPCNRKGSGGPSRPPCYKLGTMVWAIFLFGVGAC